jgi:hypothetical protein
MGVPYRQRLLLSILGPADGLEKVPEHVRGLQAGNCHSEQNMAYKADFKTTFEPAKVIQPIYTGGAVVLSEDGRILATCLGEEALLTDLNTGEHLARIEGVSHAA